MNKEFTSKIVEDVIKPNYIESIKNLNNYISRWGKIELFCDYFNTILVAAAALLAFASASFEGKYLVYISGSCALSSIVFKKCKSYSKKQVILNTEKLNATYGKLNIPLDIKDENPKPVSFDSEIRTPTPPPPLDLEPRILALENTSTKYTSLETLTDVEQPPEKLY